MLRNATRSDPTILFLNNFNGATFSRYAYSKQSMCTAKLRRTSAGAFYVSALRLKQITGVPENLFKRKRRFLAQSPFASREQAYGIKPLLSPLH
jgi:hypothetical protein